MIRIGRPKSGEIIILPGGKIEVREIGKKLTLSRELKKGGKGRK